MSERRSVFRLFSSRANRRSAVTPARSGEAWRSLLIVVPLTLLIWVYAERAQNASKDLTTQLEVATSDPNLAAAVADGGDSRVAITVNGPQGLIDLLKEKIDSKSLEGRLRVVLPAADAGVGERTIDLTRLLNEDPLLSKSGVTVTKTTPQQIRVTVDPIIARDVKIVPPQRPPVTLQRFSFDPPQLTVRGPEAAVNDLFGGEAPTIAVDLSSLVGISASGEITRVVPVVMPKDPRLTVSASRVGMTFAIISTITTGTIRSVFVDVRRPVSEDGRYKVVIRKGAVINNVQITGPANEVGPLIGGASSVHAVFKVSDEDRGKSYLEKPLEFPDLPAGVTLVGGPFSVTIDVVDVGSDAAR